MGQISPKDRGETLDDAGADVVAGTVVAVVDVVSADAVSVVSPEDSLACSDAFSAVVVSAAAVVVSAAAVVCSVGSS